MNEGGRGTTEALVILPGITADAAKKAFVLDFFRKRLKADVFLPRLWQSLGIRGAAAQLRRFLKRTTPYARVHFLAYISGGFILRAALNGKPPANIGRIVQVRGAIQEQVPRRFIEQRGRLAAALGRGRMLFDLAAPCRHALPSVPTPHEQGLVIERGVSKLAAELGFSAADFTPLRESPDFIIPPCADMLEAEESHDEVYTSVKLLGRIAAFFETGSFGGNCSGKED